jgi:hypothetical protein
LGRAKVTTTLAIYTHLFADDHFDAMAGPKAERDRPTSQNLSRTGHRTDAGTHMDRHPAPLVSALFTFADVDTRADADATTREGGHKLQAASGRLGGSVEQREDTVSGVLCPPSAVLRQQAIDHPVVSVEFMAPARVTLSAQEFG